MKMQPSAISMTKTKKKKDKKNLLVHVHGKLEILVTLRDYYVFSDIQNTGTLFSVLAEESLRFYVFVKSPYDN